MFSKTFALLFGSMVAGQSIEETLKRAVERATLDAAFLVERDHLRFGIKEESTVGLLSRIRRRHLRRGGLCEADKLR